MAQRIFYDGYGNPVSLTVLNPNEVIRASIWVGDKKKEVTISSAQDFVSKLRFQMRHREARDEADRILGVIGCDKWRLDLKTPPKREKQKSAN